MQEFRHPKTWDKEMLFSAAETEMELRNKMDNLASNMEEKGYVETKRKKLGRNDLCPCGSGNKFKKCCLSSAR